MFHAGGPVVIHVPVAERRTEIQSIQLAATQIWQRHHPLPAHSATLSLRHHTLSIRCKDTRYMGIAQRMGFYIGFGAHVTHRHHSVLALSYSPARPSKAGRPYGGSLSSHHRTAVTGADVGRHWPPFLRLWCDDTASVPAVVQPLVLRCLHRSHCLPVAQGDVGGMEFCRHPVAGVCVSSKHFKLYPQPFAKTGTRIVGQAQHVQVSDKL